MTPDLTLLFDLDGTLVVADHLHHLAFQSVFAELGQQLDFETYKARVMGGVNDAIMRDFFPDLPVSRHREIADRKEALFRASATALAPAPGTVALLDWADANGVGMAVVTNAPRANAALMLAGAGIGDRIRTVVVADELAHGKPHPLPYLRGLEALGGRADRAVAFEDSRAGIEAARGAGIFTFGLRTGLSREALHAAGANAVIADFTAPELWAHLEACLGRPSTAR